MNGHSILTEDFVICVDKWDASYLRRPGSLPHYFFLTHLHADHIKGLTSSWSRLIYTSQFNAWLLPKRRSVKPILLKELELNVTHTIQNSNGGAAFQVTLINANHCPGAVMFLFQGSFGNILYTGDFRYYPEILDNPVLSPLIRKKEISSLYLDNTYAAASCDFPSREEALQEVLQIIDKHPDHKILIGMRQLGKEEVLRAIALHLNERVYVSPQRLEILEKLEYEDVFTVDTSQSRIHAVELHSVTQSVCRDTGKVISIKLTSMYECANLDRRRGNMYVVPYSDHCSHSELKLFVSKIQPLCIAPIVQAKLPTGGSSLGPWSKMSSVNCVIPEDIWKLCGPTSKQLSSPESSPPKSRLSIRFHPPPKDSNLEIHARNRNLIDDGLNILPFDSSGPHFTIKNKARKHIKASWTRLAPKILSPKGVSFNKVSPGKRKELSTGKDLNSSVSNEHNELQNMKLQDTVDSRSPQTQLETRITLSDEEGSIIEVPLSEDDEDIDMPSSARDLRRRMQFSTKAIMINGMEDDRLNAFPEESQKITENRLHVRKCSEAHPQGKDSQTVDLSKKVPTMAEDDSSVASMRRVTRKTAAVKPDCNPRVELSEVDETDSPESGNSKNILKVPSTRIVTRKSLKEAYGKDASLDSLPEEVLLRSDSRESLSKMSTGKKSDSSGNFLKRTSSRESVALKGEARRTSPRIENKGLAKDDGKECKNKNQESQETGSLSRGSKNNDFPLKDHKKTLLKKNESLNVVLKETVEATPKADVCRPVDGVTNNIKAKSPVRNEETCKELTTNLEMQSSTKEGQSVLNTKKTVIQNGASPFSGINGIHINSPGRRRVNCDWEVAQEIARKETEQALKALESLNMMKGTKLRRSVNQVDMRDRRLSADSALQISKTVNAPPSPSCPKPNMRSRTTSILNSMSSTFLVESKGAGKSDTKKKPEPVQKSDFVQPLMPLTTVKSTQATKNIENCELSTRNVEAHDKKCSHDMAPSSKRRTLALSATKVTQKSPLKNAHVDISKVPLEVIVTNKEGPNISKVPPEGKKLHPEFHNTEDQTLTSVKEKDMPTARREEVESRFAEPLNIIENIKKTEDIHSKSLFLPESNLASSELTNITKDWMRIPSKSAHKQNSLNVNLMRLKVDFAMSSAKKGSRTSLPARIPSLKHSGVGNPHNHPSLESKEKVQAWKNKISLTLTKSPQRRFRYRAFNKTRARERSIPRLPKRNLNQSLSQNYHGDVEDSEQDATSESGPSPADVELFEGNSDYFADVESVYDKSQDIRTVKNTSKSSDALSSKQQSEMKNSIVITDSLEHASKSQHLNKNSLNINEKLVAEQSRDDGKAGERIRRSFRLHKDERLHPELEEIGPSSSSKIRPENNNGNDKSGNQTLLKKKRSVPSNTFKDSSGDREEKMKLSHQKSSEKQKSSSPSTDSSENRRNDVTFPRNAIGTNSMTLDSLPNSKESFLRPSQIKLAPQMKGNVEDTDSSNSKSSNILSLMADAFKKSVPVDKSSTTVSILSSMANTFNNFDERTQVSPSLSIQLTSSKRGSEPPTRETERGRRDWSIEIVPLSDSSQPLQSGVPLIWNSRSESRLSLTKLTGVKTPESLSIELLPGQSSSRTPAERKEPSSPSISISPDVIDLTDENEGKSFEGTTIRPSTLKSGSYFAQASPQRKPKQPEVPPAPQSVWRENRDSGYGGANVININIETEEVEPRFPHCPVHCTCGVSCKQDPCMGTANNVRKRESDSLFEVPLSPEDFDSTGAMIALGKNWIESCFDNPVDREEFFQSHEGYLHIVDNRNKLSSIQFLPVEASSPVQSHVRQVLQNVLTPNVASCSGTKPLVSCNEPAAPNPDKDPKLQKRSSTDSERSESLLREIEKKIRAYNDQQARKQTEGRSSQRRRMSLESSSSVGSTNKNVGLSKHHTPVSIVPLKTVKETKLKKSSTGTTKRSHTTTSASQSPGSSEASECKKPRLTELEKLTEAGKSASNRRYRLSVRRSLDHLMTRQKLRSDKRVKKVIAPHF